MQTTTIVCQVQVNKENLSSDRLKDCDLLIISSPQTQFMDDELDTIKKYIDEGGSLAVFSSKGATQSSESNPQRAARRLWNRH